jgi:hypothetical protein
VKQLDGVLACGRAGPVYQDWGIMIRRRARCGEARGYGQRELVEKGVEGCDKVVWNRSGCIEREAVWNLIR